MSRVLLGFLLAITIAPLTASAAHPWQPYTNKHLGFTVQYPPGWKVAAVDQFQNQQVSIIHSGKKNYAVNVTIMPFKSGATIQATKNAFIAFENKTEHNPIFVHLTWSPAAVGGRTALVTLVKPSTEGGVRLTSAVYIVTWRANVYQITLDAYERLSRLSQFPSIYGKILRTWRFI
jgi:hypothetical protein